MDDIESLGHPLVYKAATGAGPPAGMAAGQGKVPIRTAVRALTGMQKEALIHYGPTGTTWRMVSDEGPYLNGTDLAPFPLAFYTAGMAFSFAAELARAAVAAGIDLRHFRLIQDNFYTMEGSALRGDMVGGALPARLQLEVDSDAGEQALERLLKQAEQRSPAQSYMRQPLRNTFALSHNGAPLEVTGVAPCPNPLHEEPTARLAATRPLPPNSYEPGIIFKVKAAEPIFGVEGGAGSSLRATQKRTLHVRGICTPREDGLNEVVVQLFKPLGSSFRFLGDDSAAERAPASLAYLAAGVGFCFMTQIGRYAHIVKQDLRAYSIVQDTLFHVDGASAVAAPVDTHTFLQSGDPASAAQQTLYMSERTCFLHAAMRGSQPSRIALLEKGQAAAA